MAITDSTVITDDAGQGGESNANPCIKFITLREDPLYKVRMVLWLGTRPGPRELRGRG